MSDSVDETVPTQPPCPSAGGSDHRPESPSENEPARSGSETIAGQRTWGGLALKATVAFAVTLLALEAVLLITGHRYWREILQSQIQAHLSAVAASRGEMVDLEIKLLRQQAALSTERAEFRRVLAATQEAPAAELDRINAQKRLERMVDGTTVYSARLADSAGKIIFSSNPADVGQDVSAGPEFKNGLVDSYLGEPRRVNGHFEVTVAAPVQYRRMPVGVLLTSVDAASLASPLRDTKGLGENGEVLLIARKGDRLRFLFPPRQHADLPTASVADAPALAATIAEGGSFLRQVDYRGAVVLAAGSPTKYPGWAIVAKMDEAEAYAPIDRARQVRILYGALIAAAGVVAAYLLARRFTQPMRRLSEAAARVAGGDYSGQVPVTSRDEIGILSASFNEMLGAIRQRGVERDKAETALQIADQRKDNFLAILGHELRNPVSAIAAGVQEWAETEDDRDASRFVREVIGRQTENLKRLVDDLLDVARITTGKIELRKEPVKVSALISHAARTARPFIEEREHQFEISLATDSELWIEADSTRIEQVLTNVLTNAAKYTSHGGRIAITERKEGNEAVIVVSDNGMGIAAESLGKIFDLFTQGDVSLDRTSSGLGIGLNLCRELVKLHGGTISARSDGVGRGAEFTVRLPTIPQPAPGELSPPMNVVHPLVSRRILLVDDNEDNVRLLSRLLERRGHEVCVAYDGIAGLRAAHDFKPDVLILDIGLPEMDGYELARRLRAEEFATTPLIAISGYAQDSDLARGREAGFDHHFAKPVDFEALSHIILTESER